MLVREALTATDFNFQQGKVYNYQLQLTDKAYLDSVLEAGRSYYALEGDDLHIMAWIDMTPERSMGIPIRINKSRVSFVKVNLDKWISNDLLRKAVAKMEVLVADSVNGKAVGLGLRHVAGLREIGIYALGSTEQRALQNLMSWLRDM